MIARTTAEWQSTKKWLKEQINAAHLQLEREADPMTAAALRGEVRAWRRFIAEVEPVVVPKSDNPGY